MAPVRPQTKERTGHLGVVGIDCGTNIVRVDKGNEVTPEVQDVLKKWSIAKSASQEQKKDLKSDGQGER